jgi:flagellar biosynthesis protein FlhF
MDLHTYRAKSLAEALRQVREDLGPDASLLETRHVGGGPWRWLIGEGDVEVTASNQVHLPAILGGDDGRLPRADLLDFRSQFREHVRFKRGDRSSALEDLIPQPSWSQQELSSSLARICRQLAAQHVDPHFSEQLVGELRAAAEREGLRGWCQLCQQLVHLVAVRIAVRPPVRLLPATRRIVAVVGPTGVGKTTTLAKLAAHFQVREQQRVGLIAADTYRVAAAEQLRTYAQIMHLPMEVVSAPQQMRQALDRMQEVDLVLLDTAGRSPRDIEQIGQLAELLAEARPDEIHLVLAGVASPSSQAAATETFAAVGARALVLTKIDEVASPGSLLPLLCNPRLPVSYVTDGQNVPHNIRPATRQLLAHLVVGDAIVCGADDGCELTAERRY